MSVSVLRFKEFSASWNNFSLRDIAVKIQDGTHFSPVVSESGYYKYLTSKNVKNGYIDLSNLTYTSEKAHKEIYKRCDVKKGDVLLTKDGTIGQVCVNTLSEPFSLLSSVAFIRTKPTFSNYFLYHLLLSPNGQEEINKSIAGQALKRITLTKINSYIYSFPSFEEQTKIANFLTAVDEKISLLTQKHGLLTQYKKGVMQQIFSQELRFKDDDGQDFPEWEEKALGEVSEIVTGKTPSTTDVSLWDGDVQFVTPTDINEEKYQTNTARTVVNHSKLKVLPAGSIMFTCIASIGKMSLSTKPCITNQQINSLIPKRIYNNEYLFYALLSITEFIKSTQSSSTLPIINKTEFSKFIIPIPSKAEQTKIANFLTIIDDKITTTQTQLQAVKQHKQGLLQQMFV